MCLSDELLNNINIPYRFVKEIVPFSIAVSNNFDVRRIILFGSIAKGNFHSWSDIDLAILSEWKNMEMEERNNVLLDIVLHSQCFKIQPIGITENELLNNNNSFFKEISDGLEIYSNY